MKEELGFGKVGIWGFVLTYSHVSGQTRALESSATSANLDGEISFHIVKSTPTWSMNRTK